jgi:hypothetical protein
MWPSARALGHKSLSGARWESTPDQTRESVRAAYRSRSGARRRRIFMSWVVAIVSSLCLNNAGLCLRAVDPNNYRTQDACLAALNWQEKHMNPLKWNLRCVPLEEAEPYRPYLNHENSTVPSREIDHDDSSDRDADRGRAQEGGFASSDWASPTPRPRPTIHLRRQERPARPKHKVAQGARHHRGAETCDTWCSITRIFRTS